VLATPADSYIADAAAYRDYARTAAAAAMDDFIVVLGVVPAYPETGYGYIQRGECLSRPATGAYRVVQFTEKPDERTAERYLADGDYYWNMGQFVFRAGFFMGRCEVHLPHVAEAMSRLAEVEEPTAELLQETYRPLPAISMDYGIAENEENMAVVPTALEWSDIGHWRAVKEIVERHGSGRSRTGEHIGVDSRNCFVVGESGRLVVTVGLEDCVIVDTDDALLIVHEDKAQEVRAALEEIQRKGKEEHL
jgi:mannose-1-phosphate guanylyltransferase/mannose-6-phosphate isomerase